MDYASQGVHFGDKKMPKPRLSAAQMQILFMIQTLD